MRYLEMESLESRIDEFNELYNRTFKCQRPIEVAKWQFLDCPSGKSKSFLLQDSDGKIRGHWGILLHELVVGDGFFIGGKNENTMIDPELKGKGLYKRFDQYCTDKCISKGIVLWSISTRDAIRVRLKSGYTALGHLKSFQQIMHTPTNSNPLYSMYSWLLFFLRLALHFYRELYNPTRAIRNLFKRIGKNICNYNCDCMHEVEFSELIPLFSSISDYKYNTIRRTPEYMEWRFERNPNIKYHYALSNDRKSYFIYSFMSEKRILIHDIGLIDKGMFTMPSRIIITSFEQYCRNLGIDTIIFRTMMNTQLGRLLLRIGYYISFKQMKEEAGTMVIRGISEEQKEISRWFITNIFTEGTKRWSRCQ